MDLASTPRRPHKSPAHTVKELKCFPPTFRPRSRPLYIRSQVRQQLQSKIISAGRYQPHARITALAKLKQMLTADAQRQLPILHHLTIDTHSTFIEFAHCFRRARRQPDRLEQGADTDTFS